PYLLAETNWKAVKSTHYDVAVLPWGATEAHNYHLPYITDVAECDYIAAESARKAWYAGAKVIVLPTVPFGINTGQLDVKLDMNLYPSTQMAILNDVVDVVSRTEIQKLVVLNGHGGNDFKQMIREIGAQYPEMFICQMHWFRIMDLDAYFDKPGDHAGEMETSVMMHVAPDLVLPLEEAGDGAERHFKITALREKWAWAERPWTEVTESTGVGDPSRSNAEKGEAYLDDLTTKVASFYLDLAGADLDDLFE
ncbi:MAG: creatininase family protein, partial [Rhodothermales bacterium]